MLNNVSVCTQFNKIFYSSHQHSTTGSVLHFFTFQKISFTFYETYKTHTLQSTSQNHYPQKVIIIIHKS
uniref:Uncharacterized protein n=1 Tax=Anguilla anguilla TaxID=7936 RepID=A0A0E9VE89_ANGAN